MHAPVSVEHIIEEVSAGLWNHELSVCDSRRCAFFNSNDFVRPLFIADPMTIKTINQTGHERFMYHYTSSQIYCDFGRPVKHYNPSSE